MIQVLARKRSKWKIQVAKLEEDIDVEGEKVLMTTHIGNNDSYISSIIILMGNSRHHLHSSHGSGHL